MNEIKKKRDNKKNIIDRTRGGCVLNAKYGTFGAATPFELGLDLKFKYGLSLSKPLSKWLHTAKYGHVTLGHIRRPLVDYLS